MSRIIIGVADGGSFASKVPIPMRKLFPSILMALLFSSLLSATTHNVSVTSNVFTPSSLTINVGDTVVWTNMSGSHNVNGSTATYPNNPVGFSNGAASSSMWTYQFVFNTAGTYNYQCDPHVGVGMTGTITVNAASLPSQSFEVAGGSWNFTVNPTPYNTEGLGDDFIGGSEDVWDSIQVFTGDIDTSSDGLKFWGMQDLDNSNGGGSFGHTMDFSAVNVSSYSNAAITFDYYTDGYDSSDSLAYIAEFDNGSSWGSKVLLGKNTDAWTNVVIPIPSGSSFARLRIYAKQNGGSDFAGIDNVKIDTGVSVPVGPTIPAYNIADVTGSDANGVADSLNVECKLTGVVHSTDFDGSAGYSFYMYDATGGINVFSFSDVSGYTNPAQGDSIRVIGEIDQFNGLTEIVPDSIVVLGTGNSLRAPKVITTLGESTEGDYIRFNNATLVNSANWPATTGSQNFDITNGTDTITVRVDSDTDIDGTAAPTGTFDIIGAGGQFDFSSPYTDGYQLFPSSLNDIITQSAPPSSPQYPYYSIASMTTNDTANVPDSLNVKCELRGVVHSRDFDGTGGYSFYIYDNTGGVNVFNFNDVNGISTVQRGDSVRVFGDIDQFRGLTELFVDSMIVVSSGNALKSPRVVTSLDETTEGEYIKMLGVSLVDTLQWPTAGNSANVDITNGTDTLTMRIDSDTDIDGSSFPVTPFDVTGAGGQFTFSSPADDGYQILPSFRSDIVAQPATSARYPYYNIASVTTNDANFVPDSLNVECELRGIVHSRDFDGTGGYSFYIYDNTGGVNVFNFNDVNGISTVQRGDSVRVFGEIDQFRGLTELFVDSMIVVSSGNALKAPQVVSMLNESTEGEYIELRGFTVADTNQWPGSGNSANVDITNGMDTLTMRIDSDTDIDGTAVPTDTFDVRGAGGQFTFSSPANDGYQILPSFLTDIMVKPQTSARYPYYNIASVTTNDTSFVPDSLNVECELRGVVHSRDFDGTGGYSFYIYDNTGGINVFNFNDVNGISTVQRGDSVRVFGEIDQFRGLTELFVDSMIVVGSGNTLKAPQVVSMLNESTEGEYIELRGFTVADTNQWPSSGNSANVDITNGMDTLTMRIDSDTDIDGTAVPTDTFDVRGAGGQFTFSSPANDGYQILPSFLTDIMVKPQTSARYPYYSIASVTTNDANLVPDSLNVECELRGVLHSDDLDGNAGYSFYIYDNTGGINVFNFNDVNGVSNVQRGDSVRVFGEIDQFRGLTELFVDSMIVVSSGNSLKSPQVITTLDESTEGEFIEAQGFSLVNASQWPGSGSSANVDITNGTDTLTMRIDSDTDIDGTPAPTTSFDVQGAGGQFTFATPPNDGYQILPSRLTDFTFATPTNPTINFEVASESRLESAGTFDVEMSISPSATAADTAYLLFNLGAGVTTADGTITPAVDTVTGIMQLAVPASADSVFFTVTLNDDAITENTENITVTIDSTAGSLNIGTNNTYQLSILDNDKFIPTYDIADVTTSDASGVADSLNVECKLNGTVFTTDFRGGGGYQIYIYDNTGGINVFSFNDVSGYTNPQIGDSIRVVGEIIQFNGLTEIEPDSIVVLDTGRTIKPAQIVNELGESEEGEFVRFNGYRLVNPMNWPAAGNSENLDITNGHDTVQIRIDSDTDIDGTTAPVGTFDILGVGSQFDPSSPFTEGYQLFPRSLSDIRPITLPTLAITEVMPGSLHSSPVDGDWFEVRNRGTAAVNIQNFSWDDESRQRGNHTITTNTTIQPGESVVFVEVTNPDDTTWIGVWKQRGNGLTVLNEDDEFSGFSGLSSGGDEVNLYDDQQRLVSSVSYDGSVFTDGFSLEFDINGNLQGSAVDGVNGAYTSKQGDVGSPGDLSPVSLDELLANNLSVYPNPATSVLNIETGNNAVKAISLIDMTGRKVMSTNKTDELVTLDLSSLPRGVYLIQIDSEQGKVTRKLILE